MFEKIIDFGAYPGDQTSLIYVPAEYAAAFIWAPMLRKEAPYKRLMKTTLRK